MAKYCRYCGNPVREGANFCKNCGHALTRSTAQPKGTERSEKTTPVHTHAAETISDSVGVPTRNSRPGTKPVRKQSASSKKAPGKKKRSLSAASLINVLLFILCLVLIFLGLRTIPENIRDARTPVQPFGVLEYDQEIMADFAAAAESSEDRTNRDVSELHDNFSWLYAAE